MCVVRVDFFPDLCAGVRRLEVCSRFPGGVAVGIALPFDKVPLGETPVALPDSALVKYTLHDECVVVFQQGRGTVQYLAPRESRRVAVAVGPQTRDVEDGMQALVDVW